MNKKPNAFQKFLHRILMKRTISAFLARSLHHVDKTVLKFTRGKRTITEIVGLPVIQLTTLGAKSGQPRTMPLVSILDGEKIVLIASNFGGKHNPGWYYNLKANPKCTVAAGGKVTQLVAREALAAEREKYWQTAVSYYKGYDQYKIRAAHRLIPVMVLEPANNCQD